MFKKKSYSVYDDDESLDWQLTKKNIGERGKHILLSQLWTDCTFIVGEEPLQQPMKAHKLILAMASPVFEAMFYGPMAEKSDTIPITDVQPDAFEAFLTFVYADQFLMRSLEIACEICYCAKKYMMPPLVEECLQYLTYNLTASDACRTYEFATLMNEKTLEDKCLYIIRSKTFDVFRDPSWKEIKLETLIAVTEQDALDTTSENELFNAVHRWAQAECNRKSLDPTNGKHLRSVVGPAFQNIRFLSMDPHEFAEGVGLSKMLTTEEAFAILINILNRSSTIPVPEGFCTLRESRGSPRRLLNPADEIYRDDLSDDSDFLNFRHIALMHSPFD